MGVELALETAPEQMMQLKEKDTTIGEVDGVMDAQNRSAPPIQNSRPIQLFVNHMK